MDEKDSLRQVLEKMEHRGYTAVPLLTADGRYMGTVTEGDLLWKIKEVGFPDLHELEDIPITSLNRRRDNQPVNVQTNMEGLLEKITNQNFVPVVDDDHVFIGIITRKDVLSYLSDKCNIKMSSAKQERFRPVVLKA